MAIISYTKSKLGTPIVWGEAGSTIYGEARTHALSLDALASASARMGAYADLRDVDGQWDREWVAVVCAETGTAPTAGNTVEVYMACSNRTNQWPGKVTGSDAAYPATVANNKLQLGLPVNVLTATGDATTVLVQAPRIWVPTGPYVVPVYVQLLGTGLRDETAASDNGSGVIIFPFSWLAVEP